MSEGKKKLFSEKEATDIMLRAAQLQEEEPEGTDDDTYIPGLTIEELKRMAKELGVEEKYLEKALAGEKTIESEEKEKKFLGVIWSKEFETVIDGELPPENFDVVTDELPPNSRKGGGHGNSYGYGIPTQVGRSLQAGVNAGMVSGTLKMTSRKGRTRLNIKSNAFVPFMALGYPFAMMALIFGVVLPSENGMNPILIWPLVLAILGIAWFTCRAITHKGYEKMSKKFDKIAKVIEDEADHIRENLSKTSNVQDHEQEEVLENRLKDS